MRDSVKLAVISLALIGATGCSNDPLPYYEGEGASAAARGVLERRAEQTSPSASASFFPVRASQAALANRSRLPFPRTKTGVSVC